MNKCPLCQSEDFTIYKDRAICFKCKNHIIFYEFKDSFNWSKPNTAEMTTDSNGRVYHHIWFDVVTNSVVCVNGTNTTYEGIPQILMRNGDSPFGNEIVLQFVIKREKNSYPSGSPYNHIEMYLPKEKAIEVFEKILTKLKAEKKE